LLVLPLPFFMLGLYLPARPQLAHGPAGEVLLAVFVVAVGVEATFAACAGLAAGVQLLYGRRQSPREAPEQTANRGLTWNSWSQAHQFTASVVANLVASSLFAVLAVLVVGILLLVYPTLTPVLGNPLVNGVVRILPDPRFISLALLLLGAFLASWGSWVLWRQFMPAHRLRVSIVVLAVVVVVAVAPWLADLVLRHLG
jgi:hypothetical protein